MSDFYQCCPEEQAGRLRGMATEALQRWEIQAQSLELIKYRENAVFRVVSRCGEQYALRISRPGYQTEAALRSELQWIDALARDGVDVPRIIPTTDGRFLVNAQINGVPEQRQVGLFAWVEGQPLGSSEEKGGESLNTIRNTYRIVGQTAAKLHNQSTRWPIPAQFQRHSWDLEGLVGEQPFWGRFWELEALSGEQRDLLLRARERLRQGLSELGQPRDLYSLIHADFVPDNLLVDGDRVRLIDFDDAGFGWHLFEIATALYFIQEESYFDVARDALIAGYREFRPLSDQTLEHLPLFLVARGVTYLGWVRTRQETETARELTPELIRMACDVARRYLGGC